MFAAAVARDKVSGVWRKQARRSVTSLGQWGSDTGGEVDLDYHVQYSALPRPAGIGGVVGAGVLAPRGPVEPGAAAVGDTPDRGSRRWPVRGVHQDAPCARRRGLRDGNAARGVERGLPPAQGPALWEPVEPAPEPAPDSRRGGLDLFGLPGRAVATAWGATREAAGLVPALASTLEQALCRRGGPLSLVAPRTMLNVPIGGARSFTGCS